MKANLFFTLITGLLLIGLGTFYSYATSAYEPTPKNGLILSDVSDCGGSGR